MPDFLTSIEQRWRDKPYVVFLLALFINALALFLSHNYLDGDAHTRTFMALEWLRHPFFIYMPNDVTWVFGPLHCYINAAALAIWNNPPLVPRLVSLLLTSLTIFPLYYSVRMAFGARAAFYTTFLCCFCTLFIHPAAIGASEGINLFLIFAAVYYFLRYQNSASYGALGMCTLASLAATMTRYDSWPIVTMLALLAVIFASRNRRIESRAVGKREAIAAALLYALISHAFAIMWLAVQWIKLGDPLYWQVNYLNSPEIEEHIRQWGRLGVSLYALTFLPGIMLVAMPVTTCVVSAVGLFQSLRAKKITLFHWLIAALLLYYILTFVVSIKRYPLARYTTLHTMFFLVFSGAGLSYLLDRYSDRAKRLLVPLFLSVTIAVPIMLSFFSHPSENAIAEKLRAVSPLTNPPGYYFETVEECNKLLAGGNRLLLDTRNYNHRLLYLDLYRFREQLDYQWSSTDSLISFVGSVHPPFLLRTDFPRPDKPIFDLPNGAETATVAGLRYHLYARKGIYCIYSFDEK